jgi:HlyD family secretion protein
MAETKETRKQEKTWINEQPISSPSSLSQLPSYFPKWVIVVIVLGVVVTGGTIIYSLKVSKSQPSQPTPSPSLTPESKSVTALGRLEPQGEVITVAASPTQGGAKVNKLLVKEGDEVKAGQLIAILDNYDRKRAEVTLAEKDVKVAQANLNIIKAGAKTGEIEAQRATIKRLQAQLSGEIASYQAKIKRLEAQLQGEQTEQKATIDRLKAELGNAERDFQRYQQLSQDGAITDSELDQRRLKRETAKEMVKEAKAKFNKTIATLTEEILETKADYLQTVNTLQKQIQEATATLAKISEVREVDVLKAQADVERAIASLNQKKADLEVAYVKSPKDGEILKINTYPGEMVSDGKGIVELGQTHQMIVIAEVYESDINQVRVGQKATVKSENKTFPGELAGTVAEIGLKVGKKDVLDTDPAADVDVRVIEVKIKLEPEFSRRVSNLTYAKVFVKILQ